MNREEAAAPREVRRVTLGRKDLGERWGVSLGTVDTLLRDHERSLRPFRVGRQVRVRLSDVERYEDRQRAFSRR
ncbi:MAG: hypothetical protein ACFB9M_20145 [Myxococcota bacterium]